MGFIIKASGIHLPDKIVHSTEIDEMNNKKAGYTEKKTNLAKRHYVSENENVLTMAVSATNTALVKAGLAVEYMDCIIYASGTAIQSIPYGAASVNAALGNTNVKAMTFDVSSTCLSFVTALDIASKFFSTTQFKNILIVTSEVASIGLDFSNIESAGIFGDGAVAYVLERSETKNNNVFASFQSHPLHVKDCELVAGGGLYPPCEFESFDEFKSLALFNMNHKNLMKLVLSKFPGFWAEHVENSGLNTKDIKRVIPHQASYNIVRLMEKKLGFSEGTFANTFHHNGNQIAASIPTSLHLLMESGEVSEGDSVVLLGTSAGISFGALNLEV